jgi:hypothetical protein
LIRLVEPHRPLPVFHFYHAQIGVDFLFDVEHLRDFAGRHSVSDGQSVRGDKSQFVRVGNRSSDINSVDRFGRSKTKTGFPAFAASSITFCKVEMYV